MNISKITVAQLAALAQESEQVDPIDWGELSIDEEHAYLLMATHMLEQFGSLYPEIPVCIVSYLC